MNLYNRAIFKISEILTGKKLVNVVNRFEYKFIIFRDGDRPKRSTSRFYVIIKVRKYIYGIPTWEYFQKLTFIVDESLYRSAKNIYDINDNNFYYYFTQYNFLIDDSNLNNLLKLSFKYIISLENEIDLEDNFDIIDDIEQKYITYIREKRLSSLLD